VTVDEKAEGLVKRLRDSVPAYDLSVAAADALEAMAGEVERLTTNGIHSCWEECPRLPCVQGREIRALTAERDRLKAALGAIAVKAGTSECGGNYVAAVSLIGDIEQMADAALRAAGDGR
jgi:hypothetical protein